MENIYFHVEVNLTQVHSSAACVLHYLTYMNVALCISRCMSASIFCVKALIN